MRTKRKENEQYFVQKFMDFFHSEIDENASEVAEVTDKPDLAISSQGRVIGVELSQFPSRYIVKKLHEKRPAPTYTKNAIEGHLTVYPFEPHRWVHEVLQKKRKKAKSHKSRINSDEIWLVMHSHSIKRDWPMSGAEKTKTRKAEALLMRFGTKKYQSHFDRIYYIYADGTVIPLSDKSEITPTAVSLPTDSGYPAVTNHQFSFSFDVPLPGMGYREYKFDKITFKETIVPPMDEWMAKQAPEIDRPRFTASAHVDSNSMEFKIFRDGIPFESKFLVTSEHVGKTMYLHLLFEWSIKETRFTCNA